MDQIFDNVTFVCCLKKALIDIKHIESTLHLHNLTFHCKHHSIYIDFTHYVKTVIKSIFSNPKQLEVNCNFASAIENSPCYEKTQGFNNAYVILWIILFIIGLVGNFLVCLAFWKSGKLRKNVENYFVTSLAIADLLLIFFVIPVKINYALHNQKFCAPIEVCKMFITTDHVFFVASITNIFVLTIDRYITITRPYDYRQIISPFRSKIIITFIWLYSMFWAIMTNFNDKTKGFDGIKIENLQCNVHMNFHQLWIIYVCVFFLPCIIMLFIYVRIFRISLSHAKNIEYDARRVNNFRRNSERGNESRISFIIHQSTFFINRKLEARATKVLVIIFGSFLVCWLPVVVISYIQNFLYKFKNDPSKFNGVVYAIFVEILPILNSILNPFIYGVFHRDFKSSLKKILGISYLQSKRRGSGGTSKKVLLEISDFNSRLISTRLPSISISTARSNTDQIEYENTGNTDDIFKSAAESYPVYKIPEDFYPVAEIPEHDISIPETPDECITDNVFIFPSSTSYKISDIVSEEVSNDNNNNYNNRNLREENEKIEEEEEEQKEKLLEN